MKKTPPRVAYTSPSLSGSRGRSPSHFDVFRFSGGPPASAADRVCKSLTRSGYTLTEIMIVVLLIGMLTGIAVPAIMKVRREARIKEATAHVHLLAAAVRDLAWDTGLWPGGTARSSTQNPEVWDLMSGEAGLLSNDGTFSDWDGPYVHDIPETDPWGSPYFFDPDYTIGGDVRVVVGSFGPNRSGRNVYDSDNIIVFVDD